MEERTSANEDMELYLLIARTNHALLLSRQKELAKYNISPRQAFVLSTVHDLGEKATLTEISARAFRRVQSISEQITRMEQKGLLMKIRDIPGTTRIRFELTEAGHAVYDFSIKQQSIHTAMSVLSENERRQLALYLNKVLRNTDLPPDICHK